MRYASGVSYWKPHFKYELVAWFRGKFPHVAVWKWEAMTKSQLYGKYKEEREGRGK